ncbi:hypothetical protein ACLBOM_28375 [Escherichia coli]
MAIGLLTLGMLMTNGISALQNAAVIGAAVQLCDLLRDGGVV